MDEKLQPSAEPDWQRKRKENILSLDLTEATYSMSFDIMESNFEFLDLAMAKFKPWKVFKDLFKIKEREIDLSELQKGDYYDKDLPQLQTTKCGSFMGDALSFIHLTLMLASLVNQTTWSNLGRKSSRHVYADEYVKRPLGQSVGDDLIILNVDDKFCNIFMQKVSDMRLQASKINSISKDSGTFCESYVYRCALNERHLVQKDSKFGDLIFLDIIKGSLLTGKSKVKADGSDPFLGHAKMLNKQLAYLPPEEIWKGTRAKVLLWCRNYRQAVKLGRAKPHLPLALGGLDIAVGACDGFNSELMKTKYIPYYAGIVKSCKEHFLKYYTLLLGIFRTNPKGFAWSNNEEAIAIIVSEAEIVTEEEVLSRLPTWLLGKPKGQVRRYLNQIGYITVTGIADELSRREAFLRYWKGEIPTSYMSLTPKNTEQRHNDVWNIIRREVPSTVPEWHWTNFDKIASEFDLRTKGMYLKRDDPIIQKVYEGMTSMYINYGPRQ